MLKKGLSHRAIREETGASLGSISNLRRHLTDPNALMEEKFTVQKTEQAHEIKYLGAKLTNKKDFLEHVGYDDTSDQEIDYKINTREVILKTGRNCTTLVNKYEHFFKTKPIAGLNINGLLDKIEKRLSKHSRIVSQNSWKGRTKALEICIFDAHINKKTWADITGQEWNLEIAKETYNKIIADMVDKAVNLGSCYEEVVFVIGQDFFNSDNQVSKTTAGTPQDDSNPPEQAFAVGLDIIVSAIEFLQDKLDTKVQVIVLPGNHDNLLSNILGTAIKAIFKKNGNVDVDCGWSGRKYRQYGVNGVMFAHGDGPKKDVMPMLFAREEPVIRSESKYREVHLGHIHTQQVEEINGTIIRHLSSITGTDRWHNKNGYVGNIRAAQMFIWDYYNGNECQLNFNI